MAKIFNYTILVIGITQLCKLAGIVLPSSLLFSAMGLNDPSSLVLSSLIAYALLLLGGFVAGSVVFGLFGTQSNSDIVRAGIASALLLATLPDLIGISIYAFSGNFPSWIGPLVSLFIYPLAAGYVIAALQWFGGSD